MVPPESSMPPSVDQRLRMLYALLYSPTYILPRIDGEEWHQSLFSLSKWIVVLVFFSIVLHLRSPSSLQLHYNHKYVCGGFWYKFNKHLFTLLILEMRQGMRGMLICKQCLCCCMSWLCSFFFFADNLLILELIAKMREIIVEFKSKRSPKSYWLIGLLFQDKQKMLDLVKQGGTVGAHVVCYWSV